MSDEVVIEFQEAILALKFANELREIKVSEKYYDKLATMLTLKFIKEGRPIPLDDKSSEMNFMGIRILK